MRQLQCIRIWTDAINFCVCFFLFKCWTHNMCANVCETIHKIYHTERMRFQTYGAQFVCMIYSVAEIRQQHKIQWNVIHAMPYG